MKTVDLTTEELKVIDIMLTVNAKHFLGIKGYQELQRKIKIALGQL